MVLPAHKYYTRQEYLALEEKAEYRSEYYKGEIFQMAGGSANHGFIITNVGTALNNALGDLPCQASGSELKVYIAPYDMYAYPDGLVVRGDVEYAPDTTDSIVNPTVLVEVLSTSTADYDRDLKFKFYRTITAFQTYILVNQYRVSVQIFQKSQENLWMFSTFEKMEDVFKVESLDIEISVAAIYKKIKFVPEKGPKRFKTV